MKDENQKHTAARYINWYLEGPEKAKDLIIGLEARFADFHKPGKASPADFLKACSYCLEQFVLNLIESSDGATARWIKCPIRKNLFSDHRYFLGPLVTRNAVEKVRAFLDHEDLITIDRGQAGGAKRFQRSSSICATPKAVGLFKELGLSSTSIREKPVHLLRLKSTRDEDQKRKLITFEDTAETKRMRDNLVVLNDHLATLDVRLAISSSQKQQMAKYQIAKAKREGKEYVPISDRLVTYLYRVFNNGVFEDGGRFYGCDYQNIPSAYRPYITINGQPTVEVDFSAMHPTMLYADLGLQLDHDPYAISVGHRDLVKLCFNALVNAKRSNIRPLPEFDEKIVGMPWPQFVKAVKNELGPLKTFLAKGCGVKLQRRDSDIAEAVMMELVQRGVPILPVHDSFIVPAQYEGYLTRVMKEKFRAATGFECRVKAKMIASNSRRRMSVSGRIGRRSEIPSRRTSIQRRLLGCSNRPRQTGSRSVTSHSSAVIRVR